MPQGPESCWPVRGLAGWLATAIEMYAQGTRNYGYFPAVKCSYWSLFLSTGCLQMQKEHQRLYCGGVR